MPKQRKKDAGYRCPKCGGDKVEGTAWIDLNTGAEAAGDPPNDDYYCAACDDIFGTICLVVRGRCGMHAEAAGPACKPKRLKVPR